VFVIQSKYRRSLSAKAESRNDVLQFASLAHVLLGDDNAFSDFLREVDPLVGDKAKSARERCLARRYKSQRVVMAGVTWFRQILV
jgi:hypothetical protein